MSLRSIFCRQKESRTTPLIIDPTEVGLAFSTLTSNRLFPLLEKDPHREQIAQAFVTIICSKLILCLSEQYPKFCSLLLSKTYSPARDDVAHKDASGLYLILKMFYVDSITLLDIKKWLLALQENLKNSWRHRELRNFSGQLLKRLAPFINNQDTELTPPTYYQTAIPEKLLPDEHLSQKISIRSCKPPTQYSLIEKLVTILLTSTKHANFLTDIQRCVLQVGQATPLKLNDHQCENTVTNRKNVYAYLQKSGFESVQTAQIAAQITSQNSFMSLINAFTNDILTQLLDQDSNLIIRKENDANLFITLIPKSAYKFSITMTTQRSIHPLMDINTAINDNNTLSMQLNFDINLELSPNFKKFTSVEGSFSIDYSKNHKNPQLQAAYQALTNYFDGEYAKDIYEQCNKDFNNLTDKFAIGYTYE